MSIDEINEAQDSAMDTLREKIAARKALHEVETVNRAIDPILAPVREIQPLPEVTLPVGEFGEFNYERFIQIQARLDVAYGNWLAVRNNPEIMEQHLKELVRCVDWYVDESLKVRYG